MLTTYYSDKATPSEGDWNNMDWGLRTIGERGYCAMYVNQEGAIYNDLVCNSFGVRPAMWVTY